MSATLGSMSEESLRLAQGARLQKLRKLAGYRSAREAALDNDWAESSYRSHESGSRTIGLDDAEKYAKRFRAKGAADASGQWILYGGEGRPELRVVPFHEVEGDDSNFDADEYEGVSAAHEYKPKLQGGRPEIDAKPGAGLGTSGQHVAINSKGIATGHRVVAEWVLPEDYLRHEFGAVPSKVLIMEVIGDSMRGTLEPGDRIFVDTSQNVFGADAVYVIDDGDGEPRVKRLEKILFSDPPEVAIVSDNPATKREERASLDTLRIVGRVVGRATKM